jgi:hypothetical protein
MNRLEIPRGPNPPRKTRTVALLVAACASSSMLTALGACGSKSGSTPGADAGDAHATDSSSTVDSHANHDSGGGGGDGGTGTDGGDAGTPDTGSSDGGDSGCDTPDGGHYVALNWNEACSNTVTNFLVEWGTADGGPYPNVVDAGDPCDAAACMGDSGELFCQYDLRGLDAGGWCVVTVACDEGMCSGPSGQACVTIPGPCP